MKQHSKPLFENLSLTEKRAALLLGCRWQDSSRLDKTIKEMARIRASIGKRVKRFDAASVIRKIRDSR